MARATWTIQGGGGILSDECTAQENDVLKGKTAIVKDGDEPVEGTLEVQSIANFNIAVYGNLSVIGTWQNPEKGPYSGAMIRYKIGGYPVDMEDGELAYEGAETSFILEGLVDDTVYYFRAWPYMTTNYGRIYSDIQLDISHHVIQTEGIVTFTSSGSWTVPEGISYIDIFAVGGGGGGDGGNHTWAGDDTGYVDTSASSGGGSGYTQTIKNRSVTMGNILAINIGAGGNYTFSGSHGTAIYNGDKGKATSVSLNGTTILTANPGGGGSGTRGGSGGSGGGKSGNGGSDGSDGKRRDGTSSSGVGIGQHTTTRAFGEISGTLYAGGGGGSASAGGAGGGGSGYGGYGSSGTGGGGGSAPPGGIYAGGYGGSGVVLIRWHKAII